jgi:Gluconate 2-dehydrogenase subunit 3
MPASRRDFIELAVRAAALPGAAEFFAAWLKAGQEHEHSGAPPDPALLRDYQPRFFDAADFGALKSFTDILIPSDETPGAREAYCAHYIDFVLASAADVPSMQKSMLKTWRDAMATLKEIGFQAADAAGREALMAAMSEPERDPKAQHPGYQVYKLIKGQNTFAFYTSRVGLIDNLDYRGYSYNAVFPACTHPDHQEV